jgi:hypothetical protein
MANRDSQHWFPTNRLPFPTQPVPPNEAEDMNPGTVSDQGYGLARPKASKTESAISADRSPSAIARRVVSWPKAT